MLVGALGLSEPTVRYPLKGSNKGLVVRHDVASKGLMVLP
jgi:hypothetical protein